ncbi:MAG: hypothetical protein WCW14_01605 [Candidatus Paceibacterota bacterium]|jgi:hypothetical protein
MNYKLFFKTYIFTKIVYIIAAIVIILFIFQAGVFVGYRKASFSYNLGDNYYQTFGGPRGGPMMDRGPRGEEFINSHGSVGKIIQISLPTIIVSEPNGVEKIITIDDDTTVRRFREELKPTDLSINDMVVIIGSPDKKGQIDASLIRLLPPPPMNVTASSTTSASSTNLR